jgi:YfiH family protein
MARTSARPDFKSIDVLAVPGVAHGFFGRQGGVSEGIFTSLNCGPGSGDDPEAVAENRARVSSAMGAQHDKLLSLHQIHSPLCVKVEGAWQGERPKADALVSDVPGLVLSILTADCAPVLFYGSGQKGQPVIGAAHAGWRGAAGGVLDETVKMMVAEYGVDPVHIRAAVGPCIGYESYEVGQDFYDSVMAQDKAAADFLKPGAREGYFQFNLPGYCAARLTRLGLSHVSAGGHDTYKGEADFFSYRRTTHRKEGDYGRQISAIVIERE